VCRADGANINCEEAIVEEIGEQDEIEESLGEFYVFLLN